MKKFLNQNTCSVSNLSMIILSMFFVFSSFLMLADDLSASKNEDRKELISTNIKYVKNVISKKIQKSESKLEGYKINLNNSQNGIEVQIWLKKIHKVEKKIKNMNDLLFGIDLADSKIFY